jgi:sucrose-6-phosphate hydrolase SacC (GH32 family)
MSNWQYANDVPTSPWRSAMSFPRELALRDTPNGPRLVQKPVREIEQLRTRQHTLKSRTLAQANAWLQTIQLDTLLLDITLRLEAKAAGLQIITSPEDNTLLQWDASGDTIALDRTHSGEVGFHPAFSDVFEAPLNTTGNQVTLRLVSDNSSIEVFAQDGEAVISSLILPRGESLKLQLNGPASLQIHELTIHELSPSMR